MDSGDEDFMFDEDDDEPSDCDDESEDFVGVDEDSIEPAPKRSYEDDDFHYDCLTPESIVIAMKQSIDEVNSVFQVCVSASCLS